MKRGWQVVSLGFAIFFAFALWLSAKLPYGDTLGPGPGFFPIWLGLLGLVLSLALIAEVTRTMPAGNGAESLIPEKSARFRMGVVIATLTLAIACFEPVGYRFTTFFFILLLLPGLGIRSVPAVLLFAVIGSVGIFHVFYHWLKVPLPVGPFDHVFKLIGL